MNSNNNFSSIPGFLCIGFFCHDLHEENYILGGTASYSSLMASSLGKQTAVLTSVGPDFKFYPVFEKQHIQICNKPAEITTLFHNRYHKGKRTQYLYDRSMPLSASDLPKTWKQVPIVKFCLIADEVDASLLNAFPNALTAATIQGWLRKWDHNGKISPKPMNWEMLKSIDIVFMSDNDILGFESAIPEITANVKILVMTKGNKGATVFFENEQFEFPSFPVRELDPTGAGDIFAASFLVQYHKTKSIALSAAFAHAAASYIVEEVGTKIPSLEKIEKRYLAYNKSILI